MNALLLISDRRIRSTLEVVLAQRGYRVSVSASASDARRAVQQARYSLMFTELGTEASGDAELRSLLEVAHRQGCMIVGVASEGTHVGVDIDSSLSDNIHHVFRAPLDANAVREYLDDLEQRLQRGNSSAYDLGGRRVATPEEIDTLLRSDSDLDLILDSERRVRYVRPGIEMTAGYRPSELIGRDIAEFVDERDKPRLIAAVENAGSTDVRLRHPEEGWSHWQIVVQDRGENGRRRGHRLIGERVREESAPDSGDSVLQRNEETFRALVEYSTELIFVFDAEGRTVYVSPSVERLFHGEQDLGFEDEKLGRLHPSDRERAKELFKSVLESPGTVVQEEIRLRVGASDDWRSYSVTARNLLDDPTVGGVVVNAHDIAEQREAEADLQRSERRFRALVQHGSDILAILDGDAQVTFISPSVQRILGYSSDELVGQALTELVHEGDHEKSIEAFDTLRSHHGESTQSELRLRHRDGSWRVIEAHCTNLFDQPGIAGIVMNARDITDRKQLERRLTRRAFLDPLTGLPNRSLFLHRLERSLQTVPENEQPVAVLFLDIDRFKVVNDSLGHEIGDQLLIAIGRRLQGLVRPSDTVARFGGDEMIILLAGIADASEAALIARRIIEQLNSPIQLQQHEVSVAVSVGIAVSFAGEEAANDLIRNADIALYRAKESGSGRYIVFDESMANRMRERLTLESELRKAIEHGQFRLEYLPEIDLSSGRLIGLEVLVRWQHPERGEIPPDEFMLVANETGLIVPIGRQVLNQACAQLRRWHLDHPAAREIFVAVNCSAREFQQPDAVDVLTRTLDQHSLNPEHLRLEVDEEVIAADPSAAFDKLHRLRRHGIRLAIDDFGTGYSSLGYLTRVAFDTLKIARQFISGPGGITDNLSIVRAVTSLAHALNMSVTAEGIESREHLTRVRAAGCDYGQGYLFSEPLEAHAVEALLFSGASTEPGTSGG